MDHPARKQNRLRQWDYSTPAAYFVTVCTKGRAEILWDFHFVGAATGRPPKTIPLSEYGKIVEYAILEIPRHYSNVYLDRYVVMPNHVHLILRLDWVPGRAMRAPTISTIMNQMKGFASKQIGFCIWQKSFHDHIIRNQKEYEKIWQYIDQNPILWEQDCFYQQSDK